MTKYIVNNRADAWKTDIKLFFTITNCQIVLSRSLTHRINYKFMCRSTYWQLKLANERARISAVIVKKCKVVHTLSSRFSLALRVVSLIYPFSINSLVKASSRQGFVRRGSPLSVCCVMLRSATRRITMYLKNGFTNWSTESIMDTSDR